MVGCKFYLGGDITSVFIKIAIPGAWRALAVFPYVAILAFSQESTMSPAVDKKTRSRTGMNSPFWFNVFAFRSDCARLLHMSRAKDQGNFSPFESGTEPG
jgi:hypothetical protein